MMNSLRRLAILVLVALTLAAAPQSVVATDALAPAAVEDGFALMPYTSDGIPSPEAGTDGGAYLVRVTDAAGRFVGVARWDGKTVNRRNDQPGWTVPMLAWTGSSWLHLELGVAGGERSVVFLDVTSDPQTARNYRYTLAFAGSGAWAAASDENTPSTAAARSLAAEGTGGLARFLALNTDYPGVSFAVGLHEAAGRPGVHYVAVTADPTMAPANSRRLLTFRTATVECWSHEPVMAAAAALSSTESKPDVKVFATVNKQAALPGDALTYTYYLFNAGTQAPSDISATFDIPAGNVFIDGSVSGDPASVSLKAGPDGTVKSITWTPERSLEFGQVLQVSFSTTVK